MSAPTTARPSAGVAPCKPTASASRPNARAAAKSTSRTVAPGSARRLAASPVVATLAEMAVMGSTPSIRSSPSAAACTAFVAASWPATSDVRTSSSIGPSLVNAPWRIELPRVSPTVAEPVMIAVPSRAPRRMSAVSRGRREALRIASRRRTGLRAAITRNGDRQHDHGRRQQAAGQESEGEEDADDPRQQSGNPVSTHHQRRRSSSTIEPSRMAMRRSAEAPMPWSWVTRIRVEPVAVQLVEEVHHRARRLGVEVAGRLVGPHDRGPSGEGASDGDPLLLAAGQLGRPVVERGGRGPTRSSVCDGRVAGPPWPRRRRAAAAARRSRSR